MIFDAAWNEFIVNDRPPALQKLEEENTFGDNECKFSCCYLTEDGRKCAVGLVLPKEVAEDKNIINVNLFRLIELYPNIFDKSCVDSIQGALHDDLIDTRKGEWKYNLAERKTKYIQAAKDYGLNIPGDQDMGMGI